MWAMMSTGKRKEKKRDFLNVIIFSFYGLSLSLFPLPINAPKPCVYVAQVETSL